MILKVADSVKGSLVIPGVHGTFKRNTEVELSDAQIKNVEVQNLIRMGLLEGDNIPVTEVFTEYKNTSGFILNFSWGQHVRPKQNFFIDNVHLGCEEIKNFVKEGLISRVVPEKSKTVNSASKKTVKAVVKSKKTDNKSNKLNISDAAKDPQTLKDVLATQNKNLSEHVHVHEPKQDSKIDTLIKKNIGDQDVVEEKDVIEFVDKQQKKEKINKLQKIIQEKNAAGKMK